MTENQVVVEYAIKKKVPVTLTYQGHERVVSPFMLAKTKDDRLVVHAFQFGGSSSKGPVTPDAGQWRYLYLDTVDGEINVSFEKWVEPQGLKKSESMPAFVSEVIAVVPLE